MTDPWGAARVEITELRTLFLFQNALCRSHSQSECDAKAAGHAVRGESLVCVH